MAEVSCEIRVGILKFIKYMKEEKGIDIESMIDEKDINIVIEQINEARRLKLDLDIYLNICDFLERADVIKLTTLSKNLMDMYYKSIWGYLQSIHYPNSIIPYDNYIDIRHAISLDQYYYYLLFNNPKLDSFSQFDE